MIRKPFCRFGPSLISKIENSSKVIEKEQTSILNETAGTDIRQQYDAPFKDQTKCEDGPET